MKMNWREHPFVRLLLPFAVGVLFAFFDIPFLAFLRSVVPLFVLLFGLVLTAWLRQAYGRRGLFGLFVFLFFVVLGYQRTYWHDDWRRPDHFRHQLAGKEHSAVGRIVGLQDKGVRWEVRLHLFGIEDSARIWRDCRGRLLAQLPKDGATFPHMGDLLFFRGRIDRIQPPDNPAAFDFARYMRVQNIYFQVFLHKDRWQTSPSPDRRFRLSHWMARRQLDAVSILRTHLTDDDALGVGSALILGRRDGLDRETKETYSQTGAMHVLAVSGLHVGLIALLLNLLLRGLPVRSRSFEWVKWFLQVAGIWAFALLTGASPSVLRAACMFTMLLLGIRLRRYSNIYNTLAASAFLLLGVRPFMLMELGFQLSYLAVLGIVYFQPKLYRLWRVRPAIGRWIWKLTCVSFAAQLATLPVSLYYFHQFPVYFWLSGLIVVPAAAVILPLGLLLIAVHQVPVLPALLGKALLWIIQGVNLAMQGIQQLPGHLITGIWITGLTLFLLYLLAAAIVLRIETNRPRWSKLAMAIVLLIGLQNGWRQWESVRQRQIVFYRIHEHTAVDFVDGRKSYALVDEELAPEVLDRASLYFRWSEGVKHYEVLPLEGEAATTENWMYRAGFVQFYDLRLAVLDRPPPPLDQPIEVDYLLIRNNPAVDIALLLQSFTPRRLVFDASNRRGAVEQWKRSCQTLRQPYYDLTESGALVVDLAGG